MYQSPVIILGMHRDICIMITKMLENLGLFVGDKKKSITKLYFLED